MDVIVDKPLLIPGQQIVHRKSLVSAKSVVLHYIYLYIFTIGCTEISHDRDASAGHDNYHSPSDSCQGA